MWRRSCNLFAMLVGGTLSAQNPPDWTAPRRTYDVVIIGSPNVNPGYQLLNNRLYPQIAADYERTFRVLKSLPCDIFLGAHGSYFDLASKHAPFVDRQGYRNYVTEREEAFRMALARYRPSWTRKRR